MSLIGQWPFGGMRVVDWSTEIAGPYCTKMLVDAGADVVKVAPPNAGDPLRRWTAISTATRRRPSASITTTSSAVN
jgi:crotonobetainyl-CoA:carnitine CoA-transferase CaiB-like acyl-CoA transferase